MNRRDFKFIHSYTLKMSLLILVIVVLSIVNTSEKISKPEWIKSIMSTALSPSMLALLPIVYIAWAVPHKKDFHRLEDRFDKLQNRLNEHIDRHQQDAS